MEEPERQKGKETSEMEVSSEKRRSKGRGKKAGKTSGQGVH